MDQICARLLNDADLDIELKNFPDSIELLFYVVGSNIKVRMECSDIEVFDFEKSWDDSSFFVVLKTRISAPERNDFEVCNQAKAIPADELDSYMWKVSIEPGACIKLKCLTLNWLLEEMSCEEIAWFDGK